MEVVLASKRLDLCGDPWCRTVLTMLDTYSRPSAGCCAEFMVHAAGLPTHTGFRSLQQKQNEELACYTEFMKQAFADFRGGQLPMSTYILFSHNS